MKTVTTTDATRHFRELIATAQSQTVRVQLRGRDVAFVLSPEEFHRLSEAAASRANPAVKRLHAKSVGQRAEVHKALAK